MRAHAQGRDKHMPLTDREKEQIKAMIDEGQALPPWYRAVLFAEPHEAELIWPGKTDRRATGRILRPGRGNYSPSTPTQAGNRAVGPTS
jgi:hypothetical protein